MLEGKEEVIILKIDNITRSDLFNQGRICDYCGANQDSKDVDSLRFLHADCWKLYRLEGKKYRIPANYTGKIRRRKISFHCTKVIRRIT